MAYLDGGVADAFDFLCTFLTLKTFSMCIYNFSNQKEWYFRNRTPLLSLPLSTLLPQQAPCNGEWVSQPQCLVAQGVGTLHTTPSSVPPTSGQVLGSEGASQLWSIPGQLCWYTTGQTMGYYNASAPTSPHDRLAQGLTSSPCCLSCPQT